MDNKGKETKTRNLPVGGVAAIGVAWFGLVGWAAYDVERAGGGALSEAETALQALANVVNTLVLAEEGRISGKLSRL